MRQRRLLLIGINDYPLNPNTPNGARRNEDGIAFNYHSLHGCITDVNAVEDALSKYYKIPPSNICKLVSPSDNDPSSLPTKENIIKAFKKLIKDVKNSPEGYVYIHYSGHGTRAPTLSSKSGRYDECIVPCDIHTGGALIRDHVIGNYLEQIAEDSHLTVFFDCCHSASLTRAPNSVRQSGYIDDTEERWVQDSASETSSGPSSILQCSTDDARSLEDHVVNLGFRQAQKESVHAYQFFAACQANQLAQEVPADKRISAGGRCGALTSSLLLALEEVDNERRKTLTCGTLFARMNDLIRKILQLQTPIFLGNKRLYFFSSDGDKNFEDRVSIGYDPKLFTFTLYGASLQGIHEFAEYCVYRYHNKGLGKELLKLRVSEVNNSNATSTARPIYTEQDAEERLKERLKERLRKAEVTRDTTLLGILRRSAPPAVLLSPSQGMKPHYDSFKLRLQKQKPVPPFRIVSDGQHDGCPEFVVDCKIQTKKISTYRLLKDDSIPEQTKLCFEMDDIDKFLYSIGHIARVEMIKFKTAHPLNETLLEPPFGFFSFENGNQKDAITVKSDTRFKVRFENKTEGECHLVILNFTPSWGVKVLYPPRDGHSIDTIGASEKKEEEFVTDIPYGYEPPFMEVFRAIVTSGYQDCYALEMPDLDLEAGDTNRTRGAFPENWCDVLTSLNALPHVRARRADPTDSSWLTKDIKITTSRSNSEETALSDHGRRVKQPRKMSLKFILRLGRSKREGR